MTSSLNPWPEKVLTEKYCVWIQRELDDIDKGQCLEQLLAR